MEMWLKSSGKSFRFPVLPASFNLQNSSIISSSNIVGKGEISIYGGNNLSTIQITSFFPSIPYTYCNYTNYPKPYDCVKAIEDWRKKGQDLRFIITDTGINVPVIIDSFDYGERAGTRDVDFTLSLKEHNPVPLIYLGVDSGGSGGNATRPDPPKPGTQKTHTVKKGDNLWDIAHKYYGKGSKYPDIKRANQSKYPSLKKNNIIYPNWVLVIP